MTTKEEFLIELKEKISTVFDNAKATMLSDLDSGNFVNIDNLMCNKQLAYDIIEMKINDLALMFRQFKI